MATPAQAEEFREKIGSPHVFVCDPDQILFRAFGLGRGTLGQMFNPRVFARGFGAMLQGHGVGKPVGDPMQMPGAFRIEPNGEITWAYRSVDAADNPKDSVLESVLQGSSGSSNPAEK